MPKWGKACPKKHGRPGGSGGRRGVRRGNPTFGGERIKTGRRTSPEENHGIPDGRNLRVPQMRNISPSKGGNRPQHQQKAGRKKSIASSFKGTNHQRKEFLILSPSGIHSTVGKKPPLTKKRGTFITGEVHRVEKAFLPNCRALTAKRWPVSPGGPHGKGKGSSTRHLIGRESRPPGPPKGNLTKWRKGGDVCSAPRKPLVSTLKRTGPGPKTGEPRH